MTGKSNECEAGDNPDYSSRCTCGKDAPLPLAFSEMKNIEKPSIQQSMGGYLFDLAFGAVPGTVLLPVVIFGVIAFPLTIIALPGLLGIIGLWWTIMTTYKQKTQGMKLAQGLLLCCGILPAIYIAVAWPGLARVTLTMAICIAIKSLYFLKRNAERSAADC